MMISMEVFEICKKFGEDVANLEFWEFEAIMGMAFDEYHRSHPEYDPVKGARDVATAVDMINAEYGEYV